MSSLKSLLKQRAAHLPPAAPAPPPGPCLLLAGEDFGWLSGRQEIAGRRIVLAPTAGSATELLASEAFDGVLAGFSHAAASIALLDRARAAHPSLACALRADGPELSGVKTPHTVQPRTRSFEVADDQLRTMFAVTKWRAIPTFADVLGYIRQFPVLPSLYTQITSALQNENTPMESIADLVSREPAVSAKLLQMVNSPVFGRLQRVTSIREAAQVLGMTRLRALVLANGLFGQFDGSKCRSFSTEQFEMRSAQIAAWAAGISLAETFDKRIAEMAFSAGLLHQFGVLLLAANLPEAYDQVLRISQQKRISVASVERETYGLTHAELGGYILGSWGLPFPIVNAAGWYAQPSRSDDTAFSALTAVHAANSVDAFERNGLHEFDRAYLEKTTKVAKLEVWHKSLTGDGWTG